MATYWENSCSFGLRYVSWYKYLIVSLVFSHLGFWSGNLFLIAPFPDLCLLVPFSKVVKIEISVDFVYFSNFCSKHRMWVHVRTASTRRGGSNEYPRSMFWSKNKKTRCTPVYPSFAIRKVGFK